jgi:hypothetical protein
MKKTTDVWFASFIKLNGFKVVDFEIIEKGKGRFIFDLTEEQWKELRIKFSNSDISKIKQIMGELKDLLY